MKSVSVSVIVPAFNEEANLADTVHLIHRAALGVLPDYEIIIVNDCSLDQTGAVAESLVASDSRVRVIHNPQNLGFGGSYRVGLQHAVKSRVMIVPGDNEITEDSIRAVFVASQQADIVVPYTVTLQNRTLIRQILSKGFTAGMNLLFGMNLRYYNGICLLPRDLVNQIGIGTSGFAYMAQALVRLIKIKGNSYLEVPMKTLPRKHGKTKAFSIKNIISVFYTVGTLWLELQSHRSHRLIKREVSKDRI